MLKIPIITVVICLFLAILTLFSCSKSPPNPENPQSHQEQLQSLQNQLETSQQTNKETLSELHDTQIRSAWITSLCVSATIVCLFTGIEIGVKTREDALNSKSTKKGNYANDNKQENETTQEAHSET